MLTFNPGHIITVFDELYIVNDDIRNISLVKVNLPNMMMFRETREGVMATDAEYTDKVKGLLKAELKRKHVTYEELARRLAERGIIETPENIANKISRGRFTAVFMFQCLEAAGCSTIHINT